MRIRRVTFSASEYGKSDADVWILPASDRAYNGGNLGADGQVVIYNHDCPFPICMDFWDSNFGASRGAFGWDGFLLAHELGHYVFRMGDSYEEQRRIDTGCGIGPSLDVSPDPGNAAFTLDTGVNNTIMQGPGFFCLDNNQRNHNEVDPELWFAQPCRDDADCNIFTFGGAGGAGFRTCGIPQTELSFQDNHDLRVGSFDPGTNAFTGVCPGARAGHFVQIRAAWKSTATVPPSSCGNMTVDPHEECEVGQILDCASVDASFRAGTLATCSAGCRWDTSSCDRGLCGNGALEADEECDVSAGIPGGTLGGPFVACTALGGSILDTNNASCNANTCMYQRSSCLGPLGLFTCGNNVIDAGEECDGTAFGGASCASRRLFWRHRCSVERGVRLLALLLQCDSAVRQRSEIDARRGVRWRCIGRLDLPGLGYTQRCAGVRRPMRFDTAL